MTYERFRRIMMSIKKGHDAIYIGDTGPYNNQDARIKMSLYLEWCPIEYCLKLLKEIPNAKT